jgi:hypothetical protein
MRILESTYFFELYPPLIEYLKSAYNLPTQAIKTTACLYFSVRDTSREFSTGKNQLKKCFLMFLKE